MKGWKMLLVLAIVGMFVTANGILLGRADEVSIKRTKLNIAWVFIMRDWNDDAFIHIDFLSSKEENLKQPMKINVVSFHNGKIETMEFGDIHMKILQSFLEKEGGRKHSIIQLRVHNFPRCKKAQVIFHYPDGNITGWGKVFQLKKPMKDEMIEIGSPKWNELMKENGNLNTLGVIPGPWWIYFYPPFPEGDSGHFPDWCGEDHYNSDTGDAGIACWSNVVQGGYLPHDHGTANAYVGTGYWLKGMNGPGFQQIGIKCVNGEAHGNLFGPTPQMRVFTWCEEIDDNWHVIDLHFRVLWEKEGFYSDIDFDIDDGVGIWWNPNHWYHGYVMVDADAGYTDDINKIATINLGEYQPSDMDFEYIWWYFGWGWS